MCEAVMFHKGNYIVLFRVQSVEADRKSYKTVSVPKGRSNPDGAVAQLARAPALQAGCRGFEPLRLHQIPYDLGFYSVGVKIYALYGAG